MAKQSLKIQLQNLNEAKGVDLSMLSSLKGKTLYIHEGDNNTPFSGKLVEYGEKLLKFVDVTTYLNHYGLSELDNMRKALKDPEREGEILTKIPVLYKNRDSIATLLELYQEELLRTE
jgi:hypothetical protein